MQEEREAFAAFVRRVPVSILTAVEPLPYVRVLSDEDADWAWTVVEQAWGVERHQRWYPLRGRRPAHVEAFEDRHLLEAVSVERFRALLADRGVERVWDLREDGPARERDVSTFAPRYDWWETVASSSRPDWIVYASHESSITVGGWLLDAVKREWPEWHRHVWTTPFFD